MRIDPLDSNPTWDDDDDLPEPRGMGSFIILPDGRLWLGNGVGRGSAGVHLLDQPLAVFTVLMITRCRLRLGLVGSQP